MPLILTICAMILVHQILISFNMYSCSDHNLRITLTQYPQIILLPLSTLYQSLMTSVDALFINTSGKEVIMSPANIHLNHVTANSLPPFINVNIHQYHPCKQITIESVNEVKEHDQQNSDSSSSNSITFGNYRDSPTIFPTTPQEHRYIRAQTEPPRKVNSSYTQVNIFRLGLPCGSPVNKLISFKKYLFDLKVKNQQQCIESTHRNLIMGFNKDFQCILTDAEERKFLNGIVTLSLSCWITNYLVPTSKFESILPKTSKLSNEVWDNMRRYCLDELKGQLERFAQYFDLCPDSRKVLLDDNAGGNSQISEALSFHILHKLFGAKLIKTELQIRYWLPHWKKTDYIIALNEMKFGVSVTRAMKCHGDQIFNEEDARYLLEKKLDSVNASSEGVLEHDVWTKQILHIFAMNQATANTLHVVYNKLKEENPMLVSNTVMFITITNAANQGLETVRRKRKRQRTPADYYKLWGRCDWIYFNIFT